MRIFLQRKARALRLLVGALISTAFNCLTFLLCQNMAVYLFLVYFLWNPAVIYFIFREKSKSVFFTDLTACYLAFLLSGGMMEWLYAGGGGMLSYGMAAAAVLLALMALIVWSRHRMGARSCYLRVKICDHGKELWVHALIDSGNLLHDPYTGKPVSMIDREFYESGFGCAQNPRLIPYESLGCKHGMLESVLIEGLSFSYEGCAWNVKEPALGLAEHRIFEKKPYQMIINPRELLKQ